MKNHLDRIQSIRKSGHERFRDDQKDLDFDLLSFWVNKEPPFDYLVFIVPSRARGLVLPKVCLKKRGKNFEFYKRDASGHSCGPVRPLYSRYAFDLGSEKPECRPLAFVEFFSRIHAGTNAD